MSKTTGTQEIQCPNFKWKLFQRDGVYYADGRKHGHGKSSLGTRERSEAIKALCELDQLAASGELSTEAINPPAAAVATSECLSIEAGWDRYIEHRDLPIHLGGLKPSSVSKYNTHKKRFAAYCRSTGNDDWAKVDKELLKKYAKSHEGKLAPNTIHDDLTMEISVSSWLIAEGLIPQQCRIKWKLQKPAGSDPYCYEKEEVDRMLEFSKPFHRNRWLYPTILILSRTGLRIGEARNLKWQDIDFKHEVLNVRDESSANIAPHQRRHVKDGESRIIPLTEDLLAYLTANKKPSGFVLTGDQGGQLNYNHTREVFIKKVISPLSSEFPTVEETVGFENGRFHSFRHFFVSECFAAGVPESDIRLWVGHSDSKVLALYRHIRDEIAKANIRKINFGAT